MGSLNIKNITVDCDNGTTIIAPLSPNQQPLLLVRGTEYIIRANCYSNSYTNTVTSFNATSDIFSLLVGEINTAPVILVSNTSSWNQVADWSQVNVSSGAICVKMNTYGNTLIADMDDASTKSYYAEIWLQNNLSDNVLISHSVCSIKNIPEL